MAVEFPLVLYDCEFESIQWIYDHEVQEFNVTHLQQLWTNHAVKAHMVYSMLKGLDFAKIPIETGTRSESQFFFISGSDWLKLSLKLLRGEDFNW